jgi:hypothetical protein
MPWADRFNESIPLPDGNELVTLRDAADYITRLPKSKASYETWQTATANLLRAAEEGGPWIDFARLSVIQALEETSGKESS